MIILLGLPKSGTSSFQNLFERLGYKSYHWKKEHQYIGSLINNNKRNGKLLLSGFSHSDCITQMDVCIDNTHNYWPQITDYKQIVDETPNSIFILNKRDPSRLLNSFKRWNNLDHRLFAYNPDLISDKTDNGFVKFVENFYEEIETFFSTKPDVKFISYNIDNDNIKKLETHIDIKDISEFPRENVNPIH